MALPDQASGMDSVDWGELATSPLGLVAIGLSVGVVALCLWAMTKPPKNRP